MASTIAESSKIKFRYGSQIGLNSLRDNNNGESGTFYLTEDTHRLYVGLEDKSIVPVNEGIHTYETNLPPASADNAGQFAYIDKTGILAVSNGKNWVHLNPDTDTTYELNGFTSADSTENSANLKVVLKDNSKVESSASFKVVGTGGVIVYASGDTITVDGPNLSATVDNAGAFHLTVGDSTVNFKTTGNLSVKNESGAVVLHAAADSLDGKIYDTAGKEITAPQNLKTGFKAVAYDTSKNLSGTHIDPVIQYGDSKATAKFDIATGIAELDVYTKAEVDQLKQSFDAMTYIGVTSSTPAAGSGADGAIIKGDTWKASSDFTITHGDGTKESVKKGDLIIANGTESNGVITAATLKFEIVESGNEDTQYKIVGKNYGITVQEGAMGANFTDIGSFEVVAGTDISIAGGTGHNASNGNVVAQVKHATVSRDDGTAGTGTAGYGAGYVYDTADVVVIENIESSATGHITKAAKKTWTIKDTHACILEKKSMSVGVSYTTAGETSTATATTTVKLYHDDKNYDEDSAKLNVESSNPNLQLSGSGTTISMDLVWTKF